MPPRTDTPPTEATFEGFVRVTEPRLRRALVATYGPQVGREAAVDALAWAWQHRDRLDTLDNPAGYLYRVGQTAARRLLRTRTLEVELFDDIGSPATAGPDPEPALDGALRSLSEQQRAVVLLVHAYGWSQRDVAEMLGLSPSSVRNHLDRAMTKLQRRLGDGR